jgi:6-phosphogluconolactonase
VSRGQGDIRVLDDPAAEMAERLVAAVNEGGHVALTGGSTPRDAYERAAAMDADWSNVTLWFGDDRCVGPDDADSNYGMVRDALLDRIEGDGPEVRRILGEEGPERAAAEYENALHEAFADDPPVFDLVLLGLGPDGHCASLFPHQSTLEERNRPVVPVHEAALEPYVPRVSFTLPTINAAREVLFLAAGESKAQAAASAFGGEPDPGTPASLVDPDSGQLTVLLDPAAASQLEDE